MYEFNASFHMSSGLLIWYNQPKNRFSTWQSYTLKLPNEGVLYKRDLAQHLTNYVIILVKINLIIMRIFFKYCNQTQFILQFGMQWQQSQLEFMKPQASTLAFPMSMSFCRGLTE